MMILTMGGIYMYRFSISASDLRNWYFCPRLIYWRKVFKTPWVSGKVVKIGRKGENLSWLPRMARFRSCDVKRNICLRSERYRLVGCLDALIVCDREIYPLELKRGKYTGGHDIQLGAYALIVEEAFQTEVRVGFLYYPRKALEEVLIDQKLRKRVIWTIGKVREILISGKMPQPAKEKWKCLVCDHFSYCRGV